MNSSNNFKFIVSANALSEDRILAFTITAFLEVI
jgi:hypothetical protein